MSDNIDQEYEDRWQKLQDVKDILYEKYKNTPSVHKVLQEYDKQENEPEVIKEDAKNAKGEISQIAAAYLLNSAPGNIVTSLVRHGDSIPWFWPANWSTKWWTPSPQDRIKELSFGIALGLRELDRLILKNEQTSINRAGA